MKDSRRLLYILELLHTKTDQTHYETTGSILEYLNEKGFNIDRKTLGKDMDSLIDMKFGITKTKSSPNKYYWDDKLFDIAELQMLTDAVLSSRFISAKRSKDLIKKLSRLASDYDAKHIKGHISCLNKQKTTNYKVYYVVSTITEAIRHKDRVTFKYTEYDQTKKKVYRNDGKPYKVSPYRLYWNDDNYYLIGWDEKHDDVTVFRIDRMEEAKELKDSSYVPKPDSLNIDDYADKYFQMYDGEEVQVELEVRNDLMKYIIDKFGLDVETEIASDETFVARPTVKLSPTFYGWVFQFAGGVKIVGPEVAIKGYKEMHSKSYI